MNKFWARNYILFLWVIFYRNYQNYYYLIFTHFVFHIIEVSEQWLFNTILYSYLLAIVDICLNVYLFPKQKSLFLKFSNSFYGVNFRFLNSFKIDFKVLDWILAWIRVTVLSVFKFFTIFFNWHFLFFYFGKFQVWTFFFSLGKYKMPYQCN